MKMRFSPGEKNIINRLSDDPAVFAAESSDLLEKIAVDFNL